MTYLVRIIRVIEMVPQTIIKVMKMKRKSQCLVV